MKTTYEEVKRFTGLASAYLAHRPAENPLTYALRKVMRRCEIAVEDIQNEIADKRIELASVDEKKNVLFDERGHYRFTKESLLAQSKFARELDRREVEVEPHIIAPEKIPDDLPGGFDEAFDGYVLNREAVPVTNEQIAERLYETYCAAVGGVAFNCDKLPTWAEFIANPEKKKQSDAWLMIAENSRLVTGVKTAREFDLEELLRSAHHIANRKGEDVAWERFAKSISKAGIGDITARTYRVLPGDKE